jgi:hypothetical protein
MSLPPAVGSAKPDGVCVNAGDYRPTVWRVWGVSFDARIIQVVTVATVILILAFNNRFVHGEYDRFVLEFLIPVAIVVLAWREDPRRYGVALGDWRLGLPVVVGGVAAMAAIIWVLGRLPDFRANYTATIDGRPIWRLLIDTGVDLFAWEFFLQAGYCGPSAASTAPMPSGSRSSPSP